MQKQKILVNVFFLCFIDPNTMLNAIEQNVWTLVDSSTSAAVHIFFNQRSRSSKGQEQKFVRSHVTGNITNNNVCEIEQHL